MPDVADLAMILVIRVSMPVADGMRGQEAHSNDQRHAKKTI